ncbi:PREDICTED: uncharacterized protein LOC109341880 [Lupinus angustifolius]|nr:PREDICTED: uncharacterized protein LOC109341880 [Lupinus angustifolius]
MRFLLMLLPLNLLLLNPLLLSPTLLFFLIHLRQTHPPSVNELEQFLLTFESRLVKNKHKTVSDAFSANIATTESSPTQSPASVTNTAPLSHPPYRARFPSMPLFRGSSNQTYGGSRGGGRFGRRGRGNRSSGRTSVYFCEYCNRHGHDVTWCYFAPYDTSYTMPSAYDHNYNTQQFSDSYASFGHPPVLQNPAYGVPPHYTRPRTSLYSYNQPRPSYNSHSSSHYLTNPKGTVRPDTHQPPYAMNVTNTVQDFNKTSMWYPDSGATNHLTADSSLLADPTEQFASDHIYMGNGHKAPITCSGNAHFKSPFDSNISMSLYNLLLVPTITKNLLSVSQFAKDNHCFFEFHPNHCLVKSQATKQVLLKGSLTAKGLYAFSSLVKPS